MLDASVIKDSINIYGNFNQIVFFFFWLVKNHKM